MHAFGRCFYPKKRSVLSSYFISMGFLWQSYSLTLELLTCSSSSHFIHCKNECALFNQNNCGNRLQAILLIQFNKLELVIKVTIMVISVCFSSLLQWFCLLTSGVFNVDNQKALVSIRDLFQNYLKNRNTFEWKWNICTTSKLIFTPQHYFKLTSEELDNN